MEESGTCGEAVQHMGGSVHLTLMCMEGTVLLMDDPEASDVIRHREDVLYLVPNAEA